MDLETIIARGDRVEFKRYIATADNQALMLAWVQAKGVQDFGSLAFAEMQRRNS